MKICIRVADITRPLTSVDEMVKSGMNVIMHSTGGTVVRLPFTLFCVSVVVPDAIFVITCAFAFIVFSALYVRAEKSKRRYSRGTRFVHILNRCNRFGRMEDSEGDCLGEYLNGRR